VISEGRPRPFETRSTCDLAIVPWRGLSALNPHARNGGPGASVRSGGGSRPNRAAAPPPRPDWIQPSPCIRPSSRLSLASITGTPALFQSQELGIRQPRAKPLPSAGRNRRRCASLRPIAKPVGWLSSALRRLIAWSASPWRANRARMLRGMVLPPWLRPKRLCSVTNRSGHQQLRTTGRIEHRHHQPLCRSASKAHLRQRLISVEGIRSDQRRVRVRYCLPARLAAMSAAEREAAETAGRRT